LQRIRKHNLAAAIAFQSGVEQADENMALSDNVIPVVTLPLVPPPASAGYLPFIMGLRQVAVAAQNSHVGVFCSTTSNILWLKKLWIINRAGATANYFFTREDDPITGITNQAIVPAYIDAGPDALSNSCSLCRDTDAGVRGTELFAQSCRFPLVDDDILEIELEVYVQGGAFWVVNTTANQNLEVVFQGSIVPVIQNQPPG